MDTLDKKAKKILFGMFWKNGWIDHEKRKISPEDFEYAKSKGLMFDPLTISHDELIQEIGRLGREVSPEKAAKAFLSSLSTRRVDWRSGLASWYLANEYPVHLYEGITRTVGCSYENGVAIPHKRKQCKICGAKKEYCDVDLNVLNFERVRWGGVRHGNLIYTLLDLRQLINMEIPEPSAADISIFNEILRVIASSGLGDTPGTLRTNLKNILPSNKSELGIILEILAFCDILEAKSTDRPNLGGRHDWIFVTDWRGEDKYNHEMVDEIFGTWL